MKCFRLHHFIDVILIYFVLVLYTILLYWCSILLIIPVFIQYWFLTWLSDFLFFHALVYFTFSTTYLAILANNFPMTLIPLFRSDLSLTDHQIRNFLNRNQTLLNFPNKIRINFLILHNFQIINEVIYNILNLFFQMT